MEKEFQKETLSSNIRLSVILLFLDVEMAFLS